MQEYHEACLQEIENLAKQKNALDYLHRNRERYDRIRKDAKDNQMLPFHQCLKTLDRKYFIEERGYYSCGNVDVSSESLSVISAFEKVIERFGNAVGVTNYNNSLYWDAKSEKNKFKATIARENERIDEEMKTEEEEANLKNMRDLKFCEEMLKIASKCISDKTDCWHPDCDKCVPG